MKILIIVESPAKAKTIQKILSNISTDKEYIVKSSFGHIRNLCCKTHNSLGVDVNNNYKPNVKIYNASKFTKLDVYSIIDFEDYAKNGVVKEKNQLAKEAEIFWKKI